MGCIWKDRPNLHDYCATCSNATRYGCLLDGDRQPVRDYKNPSEFPMGEA